jgi:hypothetical protein
MMSNLDDCSACWTLLCLSYHKEWKNEVAQEITSLIQKYSNSTSTEPLHKTFRYSLHSLVGINLSILREYNMTDGDLLSTGRHPVWTCE